VTTSDLSALEATSQVTSPVHGGGPVAGPSVAATAVDRDDGAGDLPPHRPTLQRGDLVALGAVAGAALLWVLGLRGADPGQMTDLGLLGLLTPAAVIAVVVLTVGFFVALRRRAPEWLLGAHLVTFITLIHGTPAALFGTVRYGWAWKHVGIVDYIQRTGMVDTTLPDASAIYHSWPGFFAGTALLTELLGAPNAMALATWTPLAFNLWNLFAVRFALRGLTTDRRVVWLALWFFFVTNWLGQDYFAPQGMAFPLYAVLLGFVLRAHRASWAGSPARGEWIGGPLPVSRRAALPVMVLIMAIIASSHQITPLMMILVLSALFVFRQAHGWYVPVLAVAVTAGWALLVAGGYTAAHLTDLIESVGQAVPNAQDTFAKSESVRGGQVLVSLGGRFVLALLTALAVAGMYRSWRRRRVDGAALVLAVAPAALLIVTEYGGEVLFRVFLFASPFLAFFAALAVYPDNRTGAQTRRAVAGALLTVALLPGFLLAYYGKEKQNYFSPAEIQAVGWLYDNAEPGALIVEGSRNYPQRLRNYEKFRYLSIANEPEDGRNRVLAAPAERLARWLGGADPNGYILITRAQKTANDLTGPMPVGALDTIERALRRSAQFRVAAETRDAVVFTLSSKANR
jgi:ABC-type amino acid transport system permease subunit